MRVPVVAVAAAMLLAGCTLEGEERFFPDESVEVTQLRVNAYHENRTEGAVGLVEVYGVGASGEEHAFSGTLTVALARQNDTGEEPTYAEVNRWTVEVGPSDFESPTVPRYLFQLPAGDLAEAGTYRVAVNATVDGRAVAGGDALFWHPGAQL